MSNGIPVVKLAFNVEWKVLDLALKSDPNFEVEDIANAAETATFLGSVKGALVLTAISKKEDLIQIATLVKIYKKVAPDTAVKIVVINFSGDKNFEKATAKLGIQEVIEPGINGKALRFKIDFWMKGLSAQAKKNEAVVAAKAKTADAQKAGDKKPSDSQNAIWESPMDCEDDIWLVNNEADCKRVLGKWLIRLTGPSPYVAQWTEVTGKTNIWKFEFKGHEKDIFCPGSGTWYFKGDQKPDFVWKENVWLITGTQFDLYYQDPKEILPRLSLREKSVTICKNSEYAKTKQDLIIESFNKELVFKRDASLKTNDEVDTEGGTDHLEDMEGKGKTDKQNNGPLSGKTQGGDDLTSGLLQMDLDPSQNKPSGPMWGPAADAVNAGPELGLENKNNEHKTHYKGHNEAEQFDAKGPLFAPSSGKIREGTELDLENKNNEHETHYKGHNEAEQFEASERERKGYASENNKDYSGELEPSQQGQGGNEYGGKSSTDKINKFYSNGEKEGSSGKDEKDAGNESGSKTQKDAVTKDKAAASELKGTNKNPQQESELSELEKERELKKAKKEALEAKEKLNLEKETAQKKERALKEEQGLKSQPQESLAEKEKREEREAQSRDPLAKKETTSNKSPEREESNKKNSEEEKSQRGSFTDEVTGNMGGRSSTDKLAAHYKNHNPDDAENNDENTSKDEAEELKKKDPNYVAPTTLFGKKSDFSEAKKKEEADKEILLKSKAEKSSSGQKGGGAEVYSIEEARKSRELERVLEDEVDPEFEEACASAEIISYLVQDTIKVAAKLDDYFDQSIIFITTEAGIKTAAQVNLDLGFKYLSKNTQLKLTGNVTNIDTDDEGAQYVTVEIAAEAIKSFEAFMKLYQLRQKNVNFFIGKVKGL